jgi:cysteine-rich secretory family protein
VITFVIAQLFAQATPQISFSQEILDAHNRYRRAVGVPPLIWSVGLARSAQRWADALNSNLEFRHDPSNHTQGENIFMGTAGMFSLTEMVDAWGQERQNFRDGTFPNVSTTGKWFEVGHYSQMVWKTTTSVGCAGINGNDGYYRFVCRYSPPGNVVGEKPF